jgi:ribonuclease BN (tRNA processing enzyme)
MKSQRLILSLTGFLFTVFLFPALSAGAADTGFSLRVLGSGGPGNNPQRAEPSVLLRLGDDHILVDMGNRTQAGLAEAGLRPNELSALFITHHHLDHEQEFAPILAGSLMGRKAPLVVGPPGIKALADFVVSFYRSDIAYRRANIGVAGAIPLPEVREVQGGEELSVRGITVKTAAVNHSIETIAYRFEKDGRSIVVSGDLYYSGSLVSLAKNADILILDGGALPSTNPNTKNQPANQKAKAVPSGDRQRAHLTFEEVVSIVVSTKAKMVVLTHLSARTIDEGYVKSAFSSAGANCTVVFACDGLEL